MHTDFFERGDCAQPLHVTKHHHGWVGGNPKGYTTNTSFHAWIDGGFFKKTGDVNSAMRIGKIRPATIVDAPWKPEDLFRQLMAYRGETYKKIEPLYESSRKGNSRRGMKR